MLTKFFDRRGSKDDETPKEIVEKAKVDPNSIGNLAIEMGWCTPADIEEAMNVQRGRPRLGQILVDLGKLTEEQRIDLLIEQRLRKGEKVSSEELRQHERMKFRRRIVGIKEGFREAGTEAKNTATTVLAYVNGHVIKS